MSQRKIALFDIDKTIYDGYLIFPLAEYFCTEGIVTRGVVDGLFQDLYLYKSNLVDYETSVENFNKHWAAGLRNHDTELIRRVTKDFLETEAGNRFFTFTGPLLEFLQRTHDIYFVTGEVQFVGEAVAERFSAQGYITSEMEVDNGLFTGNVSRSLARREGKRDAIGRLLKTYPDEGSLGFGDSEGDIEMLNSVTHAFCINATEGLKQVAAARGWRVVTTESIIEEVKTAL